MKSKYDIEIELFRNTFQNNGQKIAIYGLGRRTSTLLPGITDYNIVGLLDRDESNIGKIISNIPVISLKEAEEKADIIIINSDPTNFQVIYNRIKACRLPIYYANGEKPHKIDAEYEKNPYWSQSEEELRRQIEQHEIISFDFFDTLVMRKVVDPTDVFKYIEYRVSVNDKYRYFAVARQKASANCKLVEPNLKEIYAQLVEDGYCSAIEAEYLMTKELEIEAEFCVPRHSMLAILKDCLADGKKVFIVSDTYLRKKDFKILMDKIGLGSFPEQQLILSTEERKSKMNGDIWSFKGDECKGKTHLHIGDNEIADINVPQKYGIDTFYVMSGKSMVANSSISMLLSEVITLNDSISLGMVIARMMNNPFALNKTKGKIYMDNPYDFGYALFGGVITKFLLWLYKNAKDKNVKRLLFFARDGYFLTQDFEFLQDRLSKIVEVKYLPISRRLIYLATMNNDEDYKRVVSFPYMGNFADYLKSRFNIIVHADDVNATKTVSAASDVNNLLLWLEDYKNEIIVEQEMEKDNYLKYLKTNGFMELINDAVVDFSFYGTNQYYYQNLMDRHFDGYYFFACFSDDNKYLKECKLNSCFNSKNDPNGENCLVRKKVPFWKAF